jgi:hypothetical protein
MYTLQKLCEIFRILAGVVTSNILKSWPLPEQFVKYVMVLKGVIS